MSNFTNSPLISLTNLSPHRNSPRNQPIRKITVHQFAGNATIESVSNFLAQPNRNASYNYGIGSDGRIVLIVEERNRCWASSSPTNDHEAVVIGVANNRLAPDWTVSDRAFESLISLIVDICERNGIRELVYDGTANGSLTRHNFFAATLCPGPFLQALFPEICELVNDRLSPAGAGESAQGVNLQIGGVTVRVPAIKVGSRWILPLPEGPDGQQQPDVLLRVVLEAMGFAISWNRETNTITATPRSL